MPDKKSRADTGEHDLAEPGSKICITARDKTFDAEIAPEFDSAHYFLLLDPVAWQMEIKENPHRDSEREAGVQAARYLLRQNTSILLTGRVGKEAKKELLEAGIQIVDGISGTVKDAIQIITKGVKG
jgi:predicted Fe-Mo cluster-binding NifX family protein